MIGFRSGANMTNRELILKAMPLVTLSNKEWDVLTKYMEQRKETAIGNIFEKLYTNQARLEIIGNLIDYYDPDGTVREQSVPVIS